MELAIYTVKQDAVLFSLPLLLNRLPSKQVAVSLCLSSAPFAGKVSPPLFGLASWAKAPVPPPVLGRLITTHLAKTLGSKR